MVLVPDHGEGIGREILNPEPPDHVVNGMAGTGDLHTHLRAYGRVRKHINFQCCRVIDLVLQIGLLSGHETSRECQVNSSLISAAVEFLLAHSMAQTPLLEALPPGKKAGNGCLNIKRKKIFPVAYVCG